MLEVRIHGRGGQGVVTAAEMLSVAAFLGGKHAQAFPTFGSERMGAPVTAFCRMHSEAIRSREPVAEPDVLIIQDPTLLHHVAVFDGLRDDGFVIINSIRSFEELGLGEYLGKLPAGHCITVPASQLALERVGRPLPNAALLGAFAALTGEVSINTIEKAILQRFSKKVGEGNAAAARAAYELVLQQGIPSSPKPAPLPAKPLPATAQQSGSTAHNGELSPTRLQLETSRAVAETVALCRPEVVCAYPITPQTHIVEGLAELVKTGKLSNCEFINVESEFAALSVAIGASAAGARAYTATASQGLLFMAEAVYNASGLGLPVVMTIGNRAIGAPINIWNDHSDSMALRDAGWIQLHAATAQEAADLHVFAFRLAEDLSCPVMVCVDGFVLTHAYEAVDLPTQKQVDAFLPPFHPRQVLDPANPFSIGAMVGPEAFTEVRYLQHKTMLQALERIPELSNQFLRYFGRECGGLVRKYHSDDAQVVVVALGTVTGTLEDVVDELREEGVSIGLLNICCYRPFPYEEARAALRSARRVVVIEKSFDTGGGGPVSGDLKAALANTAVQVISVITGLGGRPVRKAPLRELLRGSEEDRMEPLIFLDLKRQGIAQELEALEPAAAGPRAQAERKQVAR